jgi:hypothetical protein
MMLRVIFRIIRRLKQLQAALIHGYALSIWQGISYAEGAAYFNNYSNNYFLFCSRIT